nr:hypothetical protein GCM10020241_59770 [Streptoalloteichus tenebrarius]
MLATIGTRDVARDVEVLRAALGDAKLTYLGYSYGTRIGTAYAEAFPDRVRAMVLDGAVAPQEDPVTQQVKQVTGFQRSFDAFARWCAQQSGCALGTDPARAVPSFRALVDPLRDQPAPALDRKLSSSDATNGVIQALYDEKLWPFLHKGLQELADGRGDELLRLADLYLDRDRDGRYLRSSELQVAVNCVDGGAVADREVLKEAERRARAAAPFLDDGRPVVDVLEPCAYWPVPPTGGPHEPRVDGLPTTLVISTTGDPATPYQAGVDLARALRARLVTFEGEQHTVALRGVSCVDDAVTRYLVDLALPDEGLTCRR